LIADLGRPSRFINMMRVFRPTSPMNMGTWILTGAGALATASFLLPRLGRRRLANAAGLGAGVFGLGLCSYTGVLIANTAVPAWQYAAKELPPLFTTSAAATAAAALDLVPSTAPAMNALRLFGNAGKVGELICGHRYERALAKRGIARHVARPWMTASKALTASSVAASLLGFRRVSGILGLGGALALRFGIMSAGRSSSRDPRATFEPQRANGTSRASVEAAVGIV
jgi:formate-dependent nitrite reductase membrane component NrfD